MLQTTKTSFKKEKSFSSKGAGRIITMLLLAFSMQATAQNQSSKFIRLTTSDGLSQGHVAAILKDKKGFMWFATSGGLNKYDGYKFTAYKHNQENPSSISDNMVTSMLEDAEGTLWVTTRNGLDKFDRKKDNFVHYYPGYGNVNTVFQDSRKSIWVGTAFGLFILNTTTGQFKAYKHDSTNANSLSNDYVTKITEDNNGDLWIASRNGLNRFHPKTQLFSCYRNNPKNKTSIGSDWIETVYKDAKGNIWAGTVQSGMARYDAKTNSFVNYRHDIHNTNSVSINVVLSFCEDDKGNLWIGTENGGISIFNYSTNTFTNYKNDLSNINSLSNNSIYSLYKDDLGTVWIGTYSEGLNYLPKSGDKFVHYNQNLASSNSLNDHNILTITGDKSGDTWIGTDGGGLNKLNQKTKSFSHYLNNVNNSNSINSNYVMSVIEIDKDLLGLGLYRGGFDLLNTKTGRFSHHLPEKGNLNSLTTSTIIVLSKSRDGNVWIGTQDGGLNFYDRKKNNFTRYAHNPSDSTSIVSDYVSSILEDSGGDLWVGTGDGLERLNKTTGKFKHYRHSNKNAQSISQNFIQCIFEDHAQNVWVGTGAGLNLFNRKDETFTGYSEKDGLANDMIQSIAEDRHHNLWIASNDGLTRFNPATKAVRNYNATDGLQGKEFKHNACFQATDGQLFFGGTNGFNAFYPDSLKDNDFIPPVYITDFQVFNKHVFAADKDSPLRDEISEAKKITLSYKQSVFSFEFSALNYTLSDKNQYAYKLENFDKDWNFVGTKRSATYTNLDPGKYIFHVMGSNNDGLWNKKGTSISITILPPWWMTWWFRIGALIIILGSAAGFYLFRMSIIQEQKTRLEQKVQEQTAQLLTSNEEERKARVEADQANSAKSVFLATMSHEIRTPMNGVIGMAQLLMQTEQTPEQKSYAKTITTCGEGLLSVINGILDFSKIESGKMELENTLFDLQTCVEEALEIFSFNAAEAGIRLTYNIGADVPRQITGDSLRVRQILINLVGNAVKFTSKGEVFIGVRSINTSEDEPLQIGFEVRDTGIGIPADKIKRLFKAFSQVDSSTTRKHGGSGLGLVISEKLVALMGGKIEVTSEPGKGSTFAFSIQTTDKKQLISGHLHHIHYPVSKKGHKDGQTDVQSLSAQFAQQYPLRILIAEDNAINLLIAKKVLNKLGYQPASAENGAEVLNSLDEEEFDLILMDVQMPEMDGLEATKAIRMNQSGQQPVIIAMTANAMQGDKEECLQSGMDDYLSKPISLGDLVAVLKKWAVQIAVV